MLKHPGHLTSMKYEFGDCTKRFSLCLAWLPRRQMGGEDHVANEEDRDNKRSLAYLSTLGIHSLWQCSVLCAK